MKKNTSFLKLLFVVSFFLVSFVSNAQTVSATASHTESCCGEVAQNVTDGNISTDWASGSVPTTQAPQWITLNYTTPVIKNTCLITSKDNIDMGPGRRPKDFTIQYSTDGINFTTFANGGTLTDQTFGKATTNTYTFTNSTAYMYYRISITAIGSIGWPGETVSISEIGFTNITGPDETKPTIPSNLKAEKNSLSTVTLSWSASSDNIAVTGYDVYKDGVLAGSTTTATSLLLTGLTQGQTYLFTVKAKDAAANISDVSAEKSVNMSYFPYASSETPQYNETAANLFDLDNTTKWSGSHNVVVSVSTPEWVAVEYATGMTYIKYVLTNTVDNPERAPKDWTLEGSNNGTAWTLLDTKTAQDFVAQNPNTYTFTNATSYTFYKLTITASHSTDSYFGKFTNLAELSFSSVLTGADFNTMDKVTVYTQSGSAIVDLTSIKGATQVSIIDAKGSLVKTVKSIGNEKLNINLQNKGIYLVRILNGAKSFSTKVILN